MKTLVQIDSTAPATQFHSHTNPTSSPEDFYLAKLVFMKKTQVLMVKKPEDELWTIPEFKLRNLRNAKDRATQFSRDVLGIQISEFDRSFGPFTCDSDDEDSIKVLGVAPLDWKFISTPSDNIEIQMFPGLRVFENTDHLSRLVVNEYWIGVEDVILHG